jgi:CubicO group peptidase (beta-lactamase class C family)
MPGSLPETLHNKHIERVLRVCVTTAMFGLLVFSNLAIAAGDEYATAADLKLMEGFPPPTDKRVDRSNALFATPFNRWSYLNMRMVYPTAGIPNADIAGKIEKTIDNGIEKLKIEKDGEDGLPGGKMVDLATYLKETYSDALVVVKGNKVVYEKYLNGMDADHTHQMMSVTKSFAGLFGLIAVAEGKADENELVVAYVPELKASGAFKDATFGQVLDMTNSMDFSEDYADLESGIVQYATVLGFMEQQEGKEYEDSIYSYLQTLPFDKAHQHGEVFHYQTPKTDVVNWVTNRATNLSFQDNMYGRLWSKLGTDGETYVLLDKNATLFAGGGLNATPNDLARFAMMMVNNGKFDGKEIISKEIIEKLAAGASTKAFKNGPSSSGVMAGGDWSYRAQWWIRHTPGKAAFMAIGIHGQWIYIDVERNVAIIKQSSQPVSASDYFDGYNISAFDTIISHLTN